MLLNLISFYKQINSIKNELIELKKTILLFEDSRDIIEK